MWVAEEQHTKLGFLYIGVSCVLLQLFTQQKYYT